MPYFTADVRYTGDRELLLATRPRHREYLRALAERGTVVAAGPWSDDLGGFTVYQVADQTELDQVLADDPYTVEGVVAQRTVREWRPLLGGWLPAAG